MWSFVKRHRRKFLLAGGVACGAFLLQKYFSKKFADWQDRHAKNYVELRKRLHHFEGTLQTCDATIASFVPKLKEMVKAAFDDECIVAKLRSNPAHDKITLWEQLKVCIFARAIAELYCECILVLFLRIQLSLLGGYMYIDSRDQSGAVATADIQKRYLSLIHNLYQGGIENVSYDVGTAVQAAIGSISLKEKLCLRDLDHILSKIKNAMATNINGHITRLLSESNNQTEQQLPTTLQRMIAETYDVLENDDFGRVVTDCISRGYELLMDRLSECYLSMSQENNDFVNPNILKVPLAKLLPVMHSTLHQHSSDMQDAYVKILLQNRMLKSFSANVYETFGQHPEGLNLDAVAV